MPADEELRSFWSEGSSIYARACGRQWRLVRNGDLESLWEAMDERAFADERIPYWVELWPASIALGDWLQLNSSQIKNRLCLDLGSGLGLTALVGQYLGATVIATDYMEEALKFCSLNARVNHVPSPALAVMDWRAPAFAKACFSHIWAADILYEERFMQPVINFLDRTLAPSGKVWIAEPGRAIFRKFLDCLAQSGWQAKEVWTVQLAPHWLKNGAASAQIWELTRLLA